MAYIGNEPSTKVTGNYTVDTFTGDGANVNFSLSYAVPVGNPAALEVFVANVQQQPTVAYTISGSDNKTLAFTEAPANGDPIYVINKGEIGTLITPGTATVTTGAIVDGAVTGSKLGTIYAANITGLGSLATASSVANTQITGLITSGQIASVANSQITGNIIASQLQPTGVTAGVYGNATIIPVVTVDTQGRLTSVANTAVSLGTMATQNASSVTITGGNITGIATLGVNTSVAANAKADINGALVGNVIAVSASSIDCSASNFFTKTISGTTTFTFDTVPQSRDYAFVLQLTNGGSQTVNWPAAVVWPSATAPTLTSSGVDLLIFSTSNGGTTWRGSSLVNYSA